MKNLVITFALAGSAAFSCAASAQDAAKGEKEFRRCKACHSITTPDGEAIARGGRVGPDLYGVVGRRVASVEGFKYGPSIAAVGEKGVVWDEAGLAAYMADPRAWLKGMLGESGVKTRMTFKLKAGSEDMAAYLATLR